MADTSTYVDLEREFLRYTQNVSTRVAEVSGSASDDGAVRSIRGDIARAKTTLSDMEQEVRGMAPATRRQLGSKIKDYKATLSRLQRDLDRAAGEAERSALMAGAEGRSYQYSDASRQQMTRADEAGRRLEAGNATLAQSRAVLAETHEVAMGISGELGRQRETLTSARGKVGQVNADTSYARGIIRSMQNREFRFRILMWVIAFLLLVALIVMFVFIFKKKK